MLASLKSTLIEQLEIWQKRIPHTKKAKDAITRDRSVIMTPMNIIFQQPLREGIKKPNESVIMIIPYPDAPPPTVKEHADAPYVFYNIFLALFKNQTNRF